MPLRFRTICVLLLISSPAIANREGWANARQKAERMERRGEWAEATVWWEAAAETLEMGSAPLSALGVAEAKEDGDDGALAWWTAYGVEDAKLAAEARERAKACAAKAGTIPEETRAPVRQFIDGWIVQDSEQFWKWGRFDLRIESRRAAGDPLGAIEIEAKGRARWADRYEKICVAYCKSRRDGEREEKYAELAKRQRELSGGARDRAAWIPPGAAPSKGTTEQQLKAVARLAARGEATELRTWLECANAEVRDRAATILAGWNDPGLLTLAEDTAASRSARDALAAAEASADPEWVVARLRSLAAADVRLRTASAAALTRFFGGDSPSPEDTLAKRCVAGTDVDLSEPSTPRTDRVHWEDLEHDWRLQPPAENFPVDGWSLRASGFLELKEDLVAELIVQCDDAIRVRIDGRLVIDEWAAAPEPLFRRAPVKLSKGWHSFVLEYEDRAGVAVLRAWLAPGRDEMEPLAPHLKRPAAK